MKGLWSILVAGSALAFMFGVATADAAHFRVKCEKRSDRSRASVDAKNLVPGEYSATIMSGSNEATANPQMSIGDEVEFDFDSALDDIAAGATAIDSSFIQGGQVTGKVLQNGATVISDTVNCRLKN